MINSETEERGAGDVSPFEPQRRHHYLFAHRMLPQLAFERGDTFPALYERGLLHQGIEGVWRRVGEAIPETERLSSEGLGVVGYQVPGMRVFVVILPQAERAREAHFAAVVVGGAGPQPRYFTLEKGWVSERRARTVLCGWTRDGRHLNFGDGPECAVGSFAAAIVHKLSPV